MVDTFEEEGMAKVGKGDPQVFQIMKGGSLSLKYCGNYKIYPRPHFSQYERSERYNNHLIEHQLSSMMMKAMTEKVKRTVEKSMEVATEDGPMRLAMIISAIVFVQTSFLNYSYFLNNIRRLLGFP